MAQEKVNVVLRILDNETRLLERADQRAIALLSILGVFMVFFIVYYRVIPVSPLTVTLIVVYFVCALWAIVNLIMTIRPRIHPSQHEQPNDRYKASLFDTAFFAGICKYRDLSAYREALKDMIADDTAIINVYTSQVFSLAHINAVKYKYLRRAILLVIIAIATELAIIGYLFANYLPQGELPSPF